MSERVEAADLAEALREAVEDADEAILYYEARTDVAGYTAKNDWNVVVRVAKERRDRWQGILDRYDAQEREMLTMRIGAAMDDRDYEMWLAREYRKRGQEYVSLVMLARGANLEAISYRRQLRELERTSNGTQ